MISSIQKYCSRTYNISIDALKGKKDLRDREEYKNYNLSIILCWLLLPTQRWGSKSLIARFHGCKHKNRVYRVIRFYEANKGFKIYVNEALRGYKCDN